MITTTEYVKLDPTAAVVSCDSEELKAQALYCIIGAAYVTQGGPGEVDAAISLNVDGVQTTCFIRDVVCANGDIKMVTMKSLNDFFVAEYNFSACEWGLRQTKYCLPEEFQDASCDLEVVDILTN